MGNWSTEKTIEFLELLEGESVLWDNTHEHYKQKYIALSAWKRISASMGGIPVAELKAKRVALMGAFRPLIRRKIKSIRSGASEDDVFQPTWFAYNTMERFLGKFYENEQTEEVSRSVTIPLSPSFQNEQSSDTSSSTHFNINDHSVSKLPSRKRPRTEDPLLDMEEQIPINKCSFINKAEARSNNPPTQLGKSRASFIVKEEQTHRTHVKGNSEDVCDAYANLLAKRLQRYPERMRDKIMYKIDGLLLENPYPEESSSAVSQSQLLSYSNTPSPVYVLHQSPIQDNTDTE